MAAIETARGMKAASDRAEARQVAAYRRVMQRLSPEGQMVVNDFAFTHMRPQIVTQDPMDLASLEPEIYREQIIFAFEAERAGQTATPLTTSPPKKVLLNSGSDTRVQRQ